MSLEVLMACESTVADIALERLFPARSRRHGRSGSRSCELDTKVCRLKSAWRSKTYRVTVSRPSGTERWYYGYQDPALQRRALDRVRDKLSFTHPIGVLQEDGSFDKVPRTPPVCFQPILLSFRYVSRTYLILTADITTEPAHHSRLGRYV
jgi:hypothetical protein